MNSCPVIDSFSGAYRFLSNFYLVEIENDKMSWPSLEHAYQGAKTLDRKFKKWVQQSPTPGIAKQRGREVPIRPNWDSLKERIMLNLLRKKFDPEFYPDLAQKLIETAPAMLVEGNTWRDSYWGVYKGEGKNRLGVLLMQVRKELL